VHFIGGGGACQEFATEIFQNLKVAASALLAPNGQNCICYRYVEPQIDWWEGRHGAFAIVTPKREGRSPTFWCRSAAVPWVKVGRQGWCNCYKPIAPPLNPGQGLKRLPANLGDSAS
jgi:hypothetical protein